MNNKPIIAVAAAVVVLAAGTLLFIRSRNAPLPTVADSPAAPEPASEPPIAHPLPDSAEKSASAPLPELANSDAPLRDGLAQLSSTNAVQAYLQPENLIRRMVVTIDNLARQKVAVEKRPTTAIAGSFMVDGDELHATLDAQNFERYKPLVAVVGSLDMQKLAALYIHFYPLFQQSYQNLGYPNGYFNDRLVQVIDVLLATPQPGVIELVRPNVMYTFADPALEARPAGQKLLLRMGPDNAAVVKAKLTELRAIITAAPPKH
jgi:hypothetical protein